MARKTSKEEKATQGATGPVTGYAFSPYLKDQRRRTFYAISPNNVFQGATILPAVIPNKGRSVSEWILGLQKGTLRATMQGYYDEISTFDDVNQFQKKDLSKMTRLQMLQEKSRIDKFISDKTKEDAGNGTTE